VTFTLYSDSTCTTASNPAVTGSGTIALVSGKYVATYSQTHVALSTGTYYWKVVYAGDNNNYGFNTCGGTNETLVISKGNVGSVTMVLNATTGANITSAFAPSGTLVQDKDTLTWSGPIPGGTVTFYFYNNSSCTPPPASSQTVTLNADGSVPLTTPQPLTAGMYAYSAVYSGDGNYNGVTAACEPFMIGNPSLTPGYWKNHLSASEALIAGSQPFYIGDYPISGTSNQIGTAVTNIFNNMNCSNSSAQNAIGCLAGQLLAARLNVLNGAPLGIKSTINTAQCFLGSPSAVASAQCTLGSGGINTVTYDGITTVGVSYTGPSASFKLTANQRSVAVDLANDLSAYNASGI
jgi:hypothetical protein